MSIKSSQVAMAVGSIVALSSSVWSAQPAEEVGVLDEVIVTAQFRAENLQDTPIAITAVKGERLEAQGLNSVKDLGQIIPNANFVQPGSGSGPNASIGMRGVNTSSIYPTTDPGVGVYIDDVYHGTLTGADMDLMDLDRVEVLRGPQGTLFGKNSLGGAIRMFSKQPKGDDTGSIDLTYGSSNRLDLKASYDFAVADNLFMRVSGSSKQIDGYQDILDFTCQMNVNGTPALAGTFPTFVPSNQQRNDGDCKIGEKGGSRSNSAKVMLRYLPTTDLEIGWDADYSDTVADAPADTLLTGYGPGDADYTYSQNVVFPRFGVLVDNRFATPNSPFTTYGYNSDPVDGKIWPTDQKTQAWSTTGKVDYNINETVHLKMIGSYRTYDNQWLGNGALMPIDLHNVYNEQGHAQKTLEARLNGQGFDQRLDWTTGLYHYDSKTTLGGYVTLPAFAAFGIVNFFQNDRFSTKSNSAFLHGVFKVSEAMSLTAGGRYTDEKKTYGFDHTNFLTVAEPLHYGSSHFDWKVSLDYRFNPNFMAYGLVSTGFRSDGAQPQPFTPGQQQTPTEAEEIQAYEIGLKSDFLNRRLRVNVSAFLNDYDPRITNGFGLQCNRFNDLDPGPIYVGLAACPATTPVGIDFANGAGPPSYLWFYYTSAPGKAKGLELEITAQPIDRLEINATGGFFKYSSGVAPTAVGYVDPSVRDQPRFSGSMGIQYLFQGAAGSLIPRLDLFYKGDRTNGAQSLVQRNPDDIMPGYTLLNARLTYLASDGKWSAALAAENLTDKFYWARIGSASNTNGTPTSARSGIPGRGREISLNLRRNFN